jgi:hypothetical protein
VRRSKPGAKVCQPSGVGVAMGARVGKVAWGVSARLQPESQKNRNNSESRIASFMKFSLSLDFIQ